MTFINVRITWIKSHIDCFCVRDLNEEEFLLTGMVLWMYETYTTSKVPVFGYVLVRIFLHLGWIRTRITPNTDTFHAVLYVVGARMVFTACKRRYQRKMLFLDVKIARLNDEFLTGSYWDLLLWSLYLLWQIYLFYS